MAMTGPPRQIPLPALVDAAALLLSDDGENKEYDRAIVELVSDVIGAVSDHREVIERLLRHVRHHGSVMVLDIQVEAGSEISIDFDRHVEVWG